MARDEIKLMIHSLNQTSKAALWSFLVAWDRLHCFSFTKGGALTPKRSGRTCLNLSICSLVVH